MPRAIWSGSISFGLVNIPVKLYSAVSRRNVRFNQLDAETGSRVRQKRVNAEGQEVPFERIVKGYELSSGDYVTISEDELAGLDPKASRMIDISEFVDLVDIDPILYDSAYYLVPDQTTAKPYRLLAEALEKANKVGIARFVMRTKQYLAAIRPADGRLLLSTMVYADELVPPAEIDGFDHLAEVELDEREMLMAEQLIESLSTDFDPAEHHDTYRASLLELIERKVSGDTDAVVSAEAPDEGTVVDLMAALEASVEAAKQARGRHPASSDEKPAGKKPSKKPAKRKSA
jgi:DNA end-binding protein Ku